MKNKKEILLEFKDSKQNILCRLFGHKVGEINDSGFDICERCNSHSYYDSGTLPDKKSD